MTSIGPDSEGKHASASRPVVQAGNTSPTLIVGIGNPGTRYRTTRHNIGFLCVDNIAKRASVRLKNEHRLVDVGNGLLERTRIVVAKPTTYVNESGRAVKWLLKHYDISPQSLLVVYDDMNLRLSKLRLRIRGSAGGHNGIKSIIHSIGTNEFPRLRIGIGRPPESIGDVEFVLGRMAPDEQKEVDKAVEDAANAVICTISKGIADAMNRYN